LTLGSINKNVDTQKHKSIRARRDCESERARQSGCRLSVACETQTIYTRQQFRRQENGREITRKLWETTTKAIETNAPQRTEVTITKCTG